MTMRAAIRSLFCAATLAAAAAISLAAPIEKSLLTPDGILYTVRLAPAADLGIALDGPQPTDQVVHWSARQQDGTRETGLVPGTTNRNPKQDLHLAYDNETKTLVVLWTERFSLLNQIHVAVHRNGIWDTEGFLPSLGMALAFNPEMLLTHQTVRLQDENGREVSQNRSILSIIFWEEASVAQARYVPIFLDEELDVQELTIYDLPVLLGGGGATSLTGITPNAYLYPSLQSEGVGGGVLANFADLNRQKQHVVKITFPENLGRPRHDNLTWQRRRIPVVGVMGSGPLASNLPESSDISLETVIGVGYKPIHFWRERDSVKYTRFDGRGWAAVRSIPLDDELTYERAVRLVQEMASRN